MSQPAETVLAYLRSQVTAHGSQKALADHLGVSQQYVNDVLHGRRDISAELALLLGFERLTVFVESPKKAAAARKNGLRGGRPVKAATK